MSYSPSNSALKDKILFVFSDPGGAKPLLAYVVTKNIQNYRIISDRRYDFYKDFGLKVEEYVPWSEENIFEDFQPTLVFTATSYTSKLELKFLKYANEHEVPSCAFLDHYTNFTARFILNGLYVYPDTVLVIDQHAFDVAKQERLAEHSEIIISGHFYHDFLRNWTPSISRRDLIPSANLLDSTLLITFAAEPLFNINGKEKFGFDETDLWQDAIDVLGEVEASIDLKVILHPHPNQNMQYFMEYVHGQDFKNFLVLENIHTNPLIFYSDIIMGCCSSFLIEAHIFGKKILRHIPSSSMKDSIEHLDIGKVSRNKAELRTNFEGVINESCASDE